MEINLGVFCQYFKQNKNKLSKDDVLFTSSILKYIFESNSQHFQDIWVLHETFRRSWGYFVDFGATDGKTINNTFLLEKEYGWTGILCEPNPVWHDDLHKNRNCRISHDCVFTTSGLKVEFLATDAPDLSTINGFGNDDEHANNRKNGKIIKVNTISLVDLLEDNRAPHFIDYLSIDTEGSEYDILKAFFDSKSNYYIDLITVEHNFNQVTRKKLFDLLTANRYQRKFDSFSMCDDFYMRIK
jgi:FkbM family methyltransferase